MAKNTITESVYIIRIMLKAGSMVGIDPDVARKAIHLGQSTLDNPDTRVPMEMEAALWEILADRSGDDCVGLHAAFALEPGEFDVMDYAVRTSGTLRQALENARRYNRLLHDVAEFELVEHEGTAAFNHYFRDDPIGTNWHAADFTLASVYPSGVGITVEN